MEKFKFQAYLLMLCRNNMKNYLKVSEMLVSSLVVDSESGRQINKKAILELANSLKPFESISQEGAVRNPESIRSKAHFICKQKTTSPDLIDKIFGKPGVLEKIQPNNKTIFE